MFGSRKTEVLVVGAGPTGLVAALALADAGVAVEIIEEQADTAGHSYALALHPASLQTFERLGLAEVALALGRRVPAIGIYEGQERRADLGIGDARHPLLVLPQSALEHLLVEALAKKGVRVRWSHRLARLEPGTTGVAATVHRLERETTGYAVARSGWVVDKELRYDASYVVGADGHASLVRRILEIPFEETSPSQVYSVVECAARRPADDMRLAIGAGSLDAVWPLPSGRFRFSLQIEDSEVRAEDRFKSRLVSQVGERFFPHLDPGALLAMMAKRAPWFDPDPGSLGWSIEVRFERRLADSFGRDRVWLAGDAAHLTGPAGMQSMNAGLREAFDLATRLAAACRLGDANGALKEYGRERLQEWRFLLGKSGGLKAGAEAPAFAKKHAARLLSGLPGTDEALDALVAQIGLTPVRQGDAFQSNSIVAS
ncbi:MAG TPA: FAD-dependent monooxygenase [Candidatus Polarisedimenticolia bacterium]|nr:FAD-dependent monooxygenase [Candidatus Polarisedimenticolia bacterium]